MLGEIVELNPRSFSIDPTEDELLSFVPMAAVEEESGHLDASVARPWREVSKGYTRFEVDDVLFAKITPCMENGKCAVARGLIGGRGAGSTEFHVLRPTAAIDSQLLFHFLVREDLRKSARMKMQGAAGQLRVPPQFLYDHPLNLPPRPEQDRILEEIEKQFARLDAAVAALKRVQANLKRYRAAVLKAACEGRLVPTEADLARKEGRSYEIDEQLLAGILKDRRAKWEADQLAKMRSAGNVPRDDSWKKKYKEPESQDTSGLPRLPADWAWAALESVADAIDPQPSHRTPPACPGGVPYIGMGDIGGDGVFNRVSARKVSEAVLKEHRERYQLKHGDFFIGKIGTIGIPILVRPPFDFTLSANVVLIQPAAVAVDSRFLFHWMSSPTAQALMEKESRATTQAAFGIQRVRVLPCPIPPASEQTRISDAVEEQLSYASAAGLTVSQKLLSADRLRQSILKCAFEGKLVSRDPNDEPASALLERIRAERAMKAQPPKRACKPRKTKFGRVEVS